MSGEMAWGKDRLQLLQKKQVSAGLLLSNTVHLGVCACGGLNHLAVRTDDCTHRLQGGSGWQPRGSDGTNPPGFKFICVQQISHEGLLIIRFIFDIREERHGAWREGMQAWWDLAPCHPGLGDQCAI